MNYASVYREMAEIIGVENTKRLYEDFKGQQITFPQRLYSKEYVQEYVKSNYNGKNLRDLALKFSYTERHIRELIKKVEK